MWKVVFNYKRKSSITSKRIYEIMIRAEMESCLKLSRNHVFDDILEYTEMSYHHVIVQYVVDVLIIPLLPRGSVKFSATMRPILKEDGTLFS